MRNKFMQWQTWQTFCSKAVRWCQFSMDFLAKCSIHGMNGLPHWRGKNKCLECFSNQCHQIKWSEICVPANARPHHQAFEPENLCQNPRPNSCWFWCWFCATDCRSIFGSNSQNLWILDETTCTSRLTDIRDRLHLSCGVSNAPTKLQHTHTFASLVKTWMIAWQLVWKSSMIGFWSKHIVDLRFLSCLVCLLAPEMSIRAGFKLLLALEKYTGQSVAAPL